MRPQKQPHRMQANSMRLPLRTTGVWLLFAAVSLRSFVVFFHAANVVPITALLAAYGFLLLLETWIAGRGQGNRPVLPTGTRQPDPAHVRPGGHPGRLGGRLALAYLLLQFAIVAALLIVSTYEDFFTALVVPLSLDAVSFFGTRAGFACIAVFSAVVAGLFQFSEQGRLFGLAMAVLNGGMCFLIGGYAHQVQAAEAAHDANRRTFDELQAAHRRLRDYADQAAGLAVEQERNRLARELHDSVTQTVFSMNLAAQSARLLFDRDPPRAAGQLLRIEELAANALAEIGSLVAQLRPSPAAGDDLPAALRRLVAERGERDGLAVSLELRCERALSRAEAAALYAIAQEAVTNVARHSGARRASVRLNVAETGSCLEIADSGVGFDVGALAARPGHLGLPGMAEQAREIGWTFSVDSRPGCGARVRVTPGPPADAGGGAPNVPDGPDRAPGAAGGERGRAPDAPDTEPHGCTEDERSALPGGESVDSRPPGRAGQGVEPGSAAGGAGYRGGYLVGFVVIAVVALRAALFYRSNLYPALLLLAAYTLLYLCEPWLAARFDRQRFVYFPLQTAVMVALTNLRPFMDVSTLLYLPLSLQVVRAYRGRAAALWPAAYGVLMAATLLAGMGPAPGLALFLEILAAAAFLISYDLLYTSTHAGRAESERLLAALRSAHLRLQEYAGQAEELAAARERNRLARELHDSVSQSIFSIRLIAVSARTLLERDPARVPELLDDLQAMTAGALARLRSLIAELRPPREA